jgi:hypothetical protein
MPAHALLNHLCYVLIAILAAMLPFELRTPLLQLGPLSVTNVEVVLYLALAVWVVRALLVRHITFTVVHGAVMLMAFALVLSALFAPVERAAAWKFTLRSLGGMALCFSVADGVRTPRQRQLIVVVLVGATLLSALAALAEAWWPASRSVLSVFKTRTFNVGGFVRVGGTFEYPNTAAMFWEAALPLAVVLPTLWLRRLSTLTQAFFVILATAILIQAILLSASRAALGGAVLAMAVLVSLAWRTTSLRSTSQVATRSHEPARFDLVTKQTSQVRKPARFNSSLVGGGVALLIVALNLIANPLLALRLRTETNDSWFRAEIVADQNPITLAAGETMTMTVQLRNTSIVAWQASGPQPVRLSYHWLDAATKQTVVLNGLRTDLPDDLPPDAEVVLAARVRAPSKPGPYILQWDVLQEHVTWFSTYHNPTVNVPVTITPSSQAIAAAPAAQPVTRTMRIEPTRSELWRAAFQLWRQQPVFGIGPDAFRHVYGPQLGLVQFNTAIHTNNWYIEVLTNTGLVGAASLLLFMVMLGRAALKQLKPDLLLVGCYVALLTFFAHGLLDYFFEFTPTYGLFWLLVGLTQAKGTTVES